MHRPAGSGAPNAPPSMAEIRDVMYSPLRQYLHAVDDLAKQVADLWWRSAAAPEQRRYIEDLSPPIPWADATSQSTSPFPDFAAMCRALVAMHRWRWPDTAQERFAHRLHMEVLNCAWGTGWLAYPAASEALLPFRAVVPRYDYPNVSDRAPQDDLRDAVLDWAYDNDDGLPQLDDSDVDLGVGWYEYGQPDRVVLYARFSLDASVVKRREMATSGHTLNLAPGLLPSALVEHLQQLDAQTQGYLSAALSPLARSGGPKRDRLLCWRLYELITDRPLDDPPRDLLKWRKDIGKNWRRVK